MNKDRFREPGVSILNSLVWVFFDVRVRAGQLLLVTYVNGDSFELSMPADTDGLRIVAHVQRNLVTRVNECVKQFVLKTSSQKQLKEITKKKKFHATRINFIKRCLEIIAEMREENPEVVITQRAVAKRFYPKSFTDRDAQFSQDLKRKQISFKKLKEAGKLWEDLTFDELSNLLKT